MSNSKKQELIKQGKMKNSDFLNDLSTNEAKSKIIEFLEKNNLGRKKTTYKLRDWCVSRQRYWGPPIPMIFCKHCDKNNFFLVVEKSLKSENIEFLCKKYEFSVKYESENWGKYFLFKVSKNSDQEKNLIEFLKENILEKKWYTNGGNHVIFKNKHFEIKNADDLTQCKKYGKSLGIPEEQLDFLVLNPENSGWIPVPEKDLAVELPDLENYDDILPDGSGKSPLEKADESFTKVKCPVCGNHAKRETDVSDSFVDSSWYFLRYPCVGNDDKPFDYPDLPILKNKKNKKIKILVGTRNPAKIKMIKNILSSYEIISLNDLDFQVDDSDLIEGNDFQENAKKKAKFYFQKTGIPTISTDHILWIEKHEKNKGFITHIRKLVNPKSERASDLEVENWIKNFVKKHGKSKIRFHYAISFYSGKKEKNHDFVSVQKEYILTDKRAEGQEKGYPFDMFIFDEKLKKYKVQESIEESYSELAKSFKNIFHETSLQILKSLKEFSEKEKFDFWLKGDLAFIGLNGMDFLSKNENENPKIEILVKKENIKKVQDFLGKNAEVQDISKYSDNLSKNFRVKISNIFVNILSIKKLYDLEKSKNFPDENRKKILETYLNTRTNKWLPVDRYTGGKEHQNLHLMYTRFITLVLNDLEYLPFQEGIPKFMINGLIIKDGVKMSKSKGNVINPDIYIKKYGADAVRMYLRFIGKFEQGGDFRDSGMEGMYRFIRKVWNIFDDFEKVENDKNRKLSSELDLKTEKSEVSLNFMHKVIKKITEDMEIHSFNTSIAELMKLVNWYTEIEPKISISQKREILENLCKLMAPFAPFITEEIWQEKLGYPGSIHKKNNWPKYDPKKIIDEIVTIVVQINGKKRAEFEAERNTEKSEILSKAKSLEIIQKWISEKKIKKEIYVPNKIVNIVV